MKISGNELIENHLSGDDAAFSELLKKYLRPVYNFIFQIVRDRQVAEDIAQETFFKAWKKIKSFNPDKSFKTWIFAIAKNAAFDYFKKKKAISFSFFTDDEGNNNLENIVEDGHRLEDILGKKEAAEKLEEKLNQIPEHYKTILLLHYKEDFSLREIAEILGAPYSTVKSRHQRALAALRKLLE